MTRRDDLFTQDGTTWQRKWVGDNSGRYEWTSSDGRMVCFRDGHIYRFTIDGALTTTRSMSLVAAMRTAAEAMAVRNAA